MKDDKSGDGIPEETYNRIKLVVCDVDGVLTDGGMAYLRDGSVGGRKFNVRDGAGAALLQAVGIGVGLMTGSNSSDIQCRSKDMDCTFCITDVMDKYLEMIMVMDDLRLQANDIAYIGDEINDYPLLGHVGLFLTPSDACRAIRERADVVLDCKGGDGVLRAAADLILAARGEAEKALDDYLEGLKS